MKKSKATKRSKTKVQIRDLKPVKNAKGGGTLMLSCATGKHIDQAKLYVR